MVENSPAEFVEAVARLTNGGGVDVILDLVGGAYFAANLEAIAPLGRIICVGTTAGSKSEVDLGKILRRAKAAKKLGDYTLEELLAEVGSLQAQGIYPAGALLEAHQRVASALACVAFTLIGIPLGLKTSRRETSIGIALSLGLAFAFYFVTIFANTLKDKPGMYPDVILWSPHVAFEVIGLWLMWRAARV